MQQVLSKIKASLEESRKRIESGTHENHDLLPSLLLVIVELLEQNSEKYEKFLSKQEELLEQNSEKYEKFLSKQDELLKEEDVKRNDIFWSLVKNTNDTKQGIEEMNADFLHKLENSFTEFQKNFLAKNKVTNIVIFILLWLSLSINIALLALFIIK